MKSIKELGNIKGKRVLLRVDFNVSIKDGKVRDDFRIKKAVPTIEFLQKKGAITIILAHNEANDGTLPPFLPISKALSKYVKHTFMDEPIENAIRDKEKYLSHLKAGDVVLLSNLRTASGEKKNDVSFARGLSRLGEIYVNDAFSVSHREHASIVSLPKFLPGYAGFQFEEEVKNLSLAFSPKHPFLFILGGAKFETKIPLVKKFLKDADTVFIAGALANDFFKAKGYVVGTSLVDSANLNLKTLIKCPNLALPIDVEVSNGKNKRFTKPNDVHGDEMMVDAGPETIKYLKEQITQAKFILWNGPLGKYELGFGGATEEILKFISKSKAHSIIGGGDTVALVSKLKLEDKLGFVSTGGGATLDFLAKGTLPGIKALNK